MSDVRSALAIAAEWNAGDLGCGELVLELRGRMQALAPNGVLRLVATDPGAPADIPAWCRMTGHVLIGEHPPVYLIRRKEP
jgi:tRNA 2-thiouridine synthesizing protein A